MPPPQLPLEILLKIAHQLVDHHDDGGFCADALKSFRQVNRTVYDCFNSIFWRQVLERSHITAEQVLTSSIRTNDIAGLNFFLELGIDIETPLPEFTAETNNEFRDGPFNKPSPLIAAAYLDRVWLARVLLKNGAKVETAPFCDSAMHSARSAEMVQLLLDYHADPEARKHGYVMPLHCYALRGDIAAMRAVLQRGVKVDPVSAARCTPLLRAAQFNNANTLKLLVEFGADVRKNDATGCIPLHFAAKSGDIEVVRLLLEQWPEGVVAKNHYADTPLQWATREMRTEVVRLLVDCWPKGNRVKDREGNTPLHSAAVTGNPETVRLLVERWPGGVKVKNKARQTPLHWAAEAGRTEVVRLLVDCWPGGIRVKDRYGNTPLHSAAGIGNTEVVRLLVERCPDGIRKKDSHGDTPLHSAAAAGWTDLAKFLAESWPKGMREKNKAGQTPELSGI
jgi:ankyrin repeat protein